VGASGGELGEGGLGDEPTPVQDDDAVDGLGDLGEDVAGNEDGPSLAGQAAQQGPQPVDAFGVEAVGGFVEDEDLRVAHQRGGESEPLAHPEGELPDPAIGRAGEVDDVEHLVDSPGWGAADEGDDAEVVAGAATGIGKGRLQGRAHDAQRIGQVGVTAPVDGRCPRGGGHEAEEHAQRGGLARAVGAEEPDDAASLDGEGDVVDGGQTGEALGEAVDLDHRHADRLVAS
jgi:hypothetical protein